MPRSQPRSQLHQLSRRERQIMDILLELGEAPAEDVRIRLPDPPSYSAARAMLRKLEEKGMVRHREESLRYVYAPAISREEARESAVSRLVRVFFDGSAARAVNALVDRSASELSDDELDRLAETIEDARKRREGR